MEIETVIKLVRPHGLEALAYTVIASGLTFVGYVIYSAFLHPLASVPGPWQARCGLGWMTVRALKEDFGWKLKAE